MLWDASEKGGGVYVIEGTMNGIIIGINVVQAIIWDTIKVLGILEKKPKECITLLFCCTIIVIWALVYAGIKVIVMKGMLVPPWIVIFFAI